MFTIDISPVLLQLGGIEIRYYGLVYVFTVLMVYYALNKYKQDLGLDKEKIDSLIMWLVIGMMIGARLMHFLINDPSVFFSDPLKLLKVWQGGMSFFGGFLGLTSFGYYWMKKFKLNFFKTADILVLPLTLGLALGRIANLINQELVGRITDVSWCFKFAGYLGCRHPYVIYASISHLILFGILLYFFNKKHKDGEILALFTIIYSILRFLTDFFREDPRWLGLTSWQYMSVLFLFFGLYYYKKIKK